MRGLNHAGRRRFSITVAGSILVIIAGLSLAKTARAVDVFTEPAGFFKVTVSPGANFISAPMHRLPGFRGVVTSRTSNTVTVAGTPWTANEFGRRDNFNQFMAIVRKDAAASPGIEGDWWPVTTNTSNTVTLDVGPDNLTTLLANGSHIEVRHLTSIQDLFGSGGSLILNPDSNFIVNTADEDVIRFVVGTSFGTTIFFHDGSLAGAGYYVRPPGQAQTGPFDGSTITIQPDQAIMFFRKSAGPGSTSTNVVSIGQVQVKKLTHYLQPGGNSIGTGFPANAPIGTSGLLESGWISDSNFITSTADEDIIRAVAGTGFTDTVFHHNGALLTAGWYARPPGGSTVLSNNYPLATGRGYVFFIKPGTGALRWRQVVPFTP
jgi:uncharacterized protein (TIGR02597 family)